MLADEWTISGKQGVFHLKAQLRKGKNSLSGEHKNDVWNMV